MMPQQNSRQFLVFGNSLAASMTILALSKALSKHIKLVWVKPNIPCPSDLLYGGLSSPDAYPFNLQLGVTEPELILATDTTFSFGSRFTHWGVHSRAWMQCFHLPFSTTSGVELHHFMTRHNAQLGDYLISTQAALKGGFAHPPTDNPQSALSRAEYGYHFDPAQWATVFANKLDKTRVKVVNADVAQVQCSARGIDYVQLEDGTTLQADLYIDCSGPSSQLLSHLDSSFECQRAVQLRCETQPCTQTGPAYRSIKGAEHGWQSVTPLRHKNQLVSLFESSLGYEHNDQSACQTFAIGHRNNAWHGNCVGIGHSAYALEPITPAPYILLKKDIERLLELIPVSHDTSMERQEYNSRFIDDVKHAELFHRAIYASQRDVGYGDCEKLDRKLTQYSHRGILASYDFEPFNEQDWAILHAGLGRKPERYNRLAEQVDFAKMQASLDAMRTGIAHLASSMPPHHIYLDKLSMYLREKQKHG